MRRAVVLFTLLAAGPAVGEDTLVYVNADGQITRIEAAPPPAYLRYQYEPVDCVTLPCPNYFVLAAEQPYDDGVVIWSGEEPPMIEASKKTVAAMQNELDGPACWVIRGEFGLDDSAPWLRIDELVDACY